MKFILALKLVYDMIIISIKSKIYKKNIYLVGIPTHGNLGDQAILYSEILYLKNNFSNYKIIMVDSILVRKKIKFLIKKINESPILVHGGGYLGTLWLKEEYMFRNIVLNFPNNKIFVFPQTVFFDETEEGKSILAESKKIYESHKKLVFFCRENYSYKYMKKNFEKCLCYLVPDMVLYLNDKIELNKNKENLREKKALFCIRNDNEKINYNFESIIFVLEKLSFKAIDYTDTVLKRNIYSISRKKLILKKLKQISKYDLIVTDRLHGMVFCLLTKTPCIVFENKSYKIRGLYKWLESCNYILLYDDDFEKKINKLLSINKFSTLNFDTGFNILTKTIREGLNNGD